MKTYQIILQVLGVIFLILLIQYLRAYFTTDDNECKELNWTYFPMNGMRICKGEKASGDSSTPTQTNTATGTSTDTTQ